MGMREKALEAFNSERGVEFTIDLIWELTIASRASRSEPGTGCEIQREQLIGYLELQHLLAGAIRMAKRTHGPLNINDDFIGSIRERSRIYSIEGEVQASVYRSLKRIASS